MFLLILLVSYGNLVVAKVQKTQQTDKNMCKKQGNILLPQIGKQSIVSTQINRPAVPVPQAVHVNYALSCWHARRVFINIIKFSRTVNAVSHWT